MIIIFFILIIVIVFLLYYYKERINYYTIELVKSDIDNELYLVRSNETKFEAANMLAKININMKKLVEYLNKNINSKEYENYIPYINQLTEKIKNTKIQENSDNGIYTSYSVNKGEQVIFCLRSRSANLNENNKIHELNLLMYVVIHEMAHVACPEYGHTDLFKQIFAFLAEESIKVGIYSKIDFNKENKEYCGLKITESII